MMTFTPFPFDLEGDHGHQLLFASDTGARVLQGTPDPVAIGALDLRSENRDFHMPFAGVALAAQEALFVAIPPGSKQHIVPLRGGGQGIWIAAPSDATFKPTAYGLLRLPFGDIGALCDRMRQEARHLSWLIKRKIKQTFIPS